MLFIGYQICITSFAHVHYVNGVLISHSHPFSDANHSHQKTEFTFIAKLSHFTALELEAIELENPFFTLVSKVNISYQVDAYSIATPYYFSLRAPPIFVL